MGNVNRKATDAEMQHAVSVIRKAFPNLEPIFGGHGMHRGHRSPRDHTISFRLQDIRGKFHSNVVWILPEYLGSVTVGMVRSMVAEQNGQPTRKKKNRKKRR